MFPKVDKKKEFLKSFAINMASGGLAGAGSLAIVYPLDYARTRLASDVGSGEKQFKGLLDCLVKTSAGPKGPLGLYNGFGVSVAGIIPYRGVYFGFFDTLMDNNPWAKADNSTFRAASTFFCAQTAAISAGYASYPFDTVRRRLQMQSEKPKVSVSAVGLCCESPYLVVQPNAAQSEWLYQGTFDCAAKIVKDEGVSAMFKGAGANALRTVGAALVLVFYSEITRAAGINVGSGGGE